MLTTNFENTFTNTSSDFYLGVRLKDTLKRKIKDEYIVKNKKLVCVATCTGKTYLLTLLME